MTIFAALGAGLLLVVPPEPAWRLPDERFGVRTAPLLLLSRSDVQNDLGLDAEQVDSANRAVLNLFERAQKLRHLRNEPEALAARRAIDEAQYQWMEETLTPEQRSRLRQIDWQWEGPSALLTRTDLAERVKLDEKAREALTRLLSESPCTWADRDRAIEQAGGPSMRNSGSATIG